MIWVKNRDTNYNWSVYHADLGSSQYLELDGTAAAAAASTSYWQQTDPTASVFYVGNRSALNASGQDIIAYLFATLAGISKVGSFTYNSSSNLDVDCGFSNGARFVLCKKYSGTGSWFVWDTERGIVAGNDPTLELNNTNSEYSTYDLIDPLSSGFRIPSNSFGNGDYIFYAIA